MIIEKEIEILDGLPIIYIKKLSAIVCSDLHLGYEGVAAERGTFLPKTNLRHIMKILKEAKNRTNANAIIITGDIKNDFSKFHLEELNEYLELVNYLKNMLNINDIRIIKGNHDNFLDSVSVKNNNIRIYGSEVKFDDFLFMHGAALPKEKTARFIIMGHIHPSIMLITDMGKKEKLQCFLFSKKNGKNNLIVLPALSYFAEGLSVNIEHVQAVAPIFKDLFDINETKALCIGENETLDFGKIGKLKNILQ